MAQEIQIPGENLSVKPNKQKLRKHLQGHVEPILVDKISVQKEKQNGEINDRHLSDDSSEQPA